MFNMIQLTIALLVGITFSTEAFADTWVNGYFRSDGTYVPGHYRSDRNDTKLDNWSVYPNYNPYTLEQGTRRVPLYEEIRPLAVPEVSFKSKDGMLYKCYGDRCYPVYPVY